ncbi:hypothetical protein [Streptococcus suis]|uniref:Uncharacterized protein n=1 Tax=Streptococcus suis TaxID=1307 RepID=A0A540UPJ3_STRSU|nr:hypothetical protein [Streptococcus suis]TQE86416.1 hypothetical protein FH692_10595 [Streptococcus suis]HEM3214256.1 hypothetical protein [Streptococcus suis 12814]HEM4252946.1 hypothetical protein [Streptococcus suis]HEM5251558.1 hypothetical protein [Streptococcus suis]
MGSSAISQKYPNRKDESVLRANIASYQASLAHQSTLYNRLMGEDILNFRSLNSLQKEQEKLDRLLTFDS